MELPKKSPVRSYKTEFKKNETPLSEGGLWLKGRKDGMVTWKREDLGPDGTHPSLMGREKVAWLLMTFLKNDPTSRSWFLAAK